MCVEFVFLKASVDVTSQLYNALKYSPNLKQHTLTTLPNKLATIALKSSEVACRLFRGTERRQGGGNVPLSSRRIKGTVETLARGGEVECAGAGAGAGAGGGAGAGSCAGAGSGALLTSGATFGSFAVGR